MPSEFQEVADELMREKIDNPTKPRFQPNATVDSSTELKGPLVTGKLIGYKADRDYPYFNVKSGDFFKIESKISYGGEWCYHRISSYNLDSFFVESHFIPVYEEEKKNWKVKWLITSDGAIIKNYKGQKISPISFDSKEEAHKWIRENGIKGVYYKAEPYEIDEE